MAGRPDLAADLTPIYRFLLTMEAPILKEHGVTMWEYTVLNRLADHPIRGQAVLADAIGADKTRLIDVLDGLQEAGLIRREPDPADRRARILAITPDGRKVRTRVQRAIQAREQPLLRALPVERREGFLTALRLLSDEVARLSETPQHGNS